MVFRRIGHIRYALSTGENAVVIVNNYDCSCPVCVAMRAVESGSCQYRLRNNSLMRHGLIVWRDYVLHVLCREITFEVLTQGISGVMFP
ncbi:hypothetical protein [Candidatus Anaplasma sp. TIGMIC]|uniref:hypothetical protein n=1 Tax=Candidatus Anaplasma sp. TIGMIC TaxID=3020713 RepID=UPI00232B52BE|nr:hypothetical protein [Candidatus Anaplasma sp. TIGMIC]MDB1135809.1 hypothetical protein [Candidatus Anaplasma sp. TIGMIC]